MAGLVWAHGLACRASRKNLRAMASDRCLRCNPLVLTTGPPSTYSITSRILVLRASSAHACASVREPRHACQPAGLPEARQAGLPGLSAHALVVIMMSDASNTRE